MFFWNSLAFLMIQWMLTIWSIIYSKMKLYLVLEKGRGTRDKIANIHWIIKKAREFQKNIYFCFMGYAKAFDSVNHNKLENSEEDGNTRPSDLPLEKPVCRSGNNS